MVFERTLPICYDHSSTDGKLDSLMKKCDFCVKEFIYECALIHLIMMNYVKKI